MLEARAMPRDDNTRTLGRLQSREYPTPDNADLASETRHKKAFWDVRGDQEAKAKRAHKPIKRETIAWLERSGLIDKSTGKLLRRDRLLYTPDKGYSYRQESWWEDNGRSLWDYKVQEDEQRRAKARLCVLPRSTRTLDQWPMDRELCEYLDKLTKSVNKRGGNVEKLVGYTAKGAPVFRLLRRPGETGYYN
jgi:hypothetical protein